MIKHLSITAAAPGLELLVTDHGEVDIRYPVVAWIITGKHMTEAGVIRYGQMLAQSDIEASDSDVSTEIVAAGADFVYELDTEIVAEKAVVTGGSRDTAAVIADMALDAVFGPVTNG